MTGDGDASSGRRSNGKSESAFRTISEVADDLEVPQHVLRFWESKFPQVRPLKRGGGRRYYRPEDVALLRRIRDLLYSEGYTIKGVQKLLREGGHKDAPAPSSAPARDEPELQLDLSPQADDVEEDDFTIMDDGEEDDQQAMELEADMVVRPAAEAGLHPEIRQELALLLNELEQMRSLLRPKQR